MEFLGILKDAWPFLALLVGVKLAVSLIHALFRVAKGAIGERMVTRALEKNLDYRAVVLNDVTLRTGDNGTTQIDHIVVAPHGIYVIETKRYRGKIFGKPREAEWVQKIGTRKYRFLNPFFQNFRHTQTINEIMPSIDKSCINSIVIMTGCRWGQGKPPERLFHSGEQAACYINEKAKWSKAKINVAEVVEAINAHREKPGLATWLKHVWHVRRKKTETSHAS
ncbi:MAG: NERD domain-containing protein [Chloroflexi bacterium]|nr:MAG: NERD domain-containing protein [Chloroflexota bacterium]